MKSNRTIKSFIETQALRSRGLLCAGYAAVPTMGHDWSNPEQEVRE